MDVGWLIKKATARAQVACDADFGTGVRYESLQNDQMLEIFFRCLLMG